MDGNSLKFSETDKNDGRCQEARQRPEYQVPGSKSKANSIPSERSAQDNMHKGAGKGSLEKSTDAKYRYFYRALVNGTNR